MAYERIGRHADGSEGKKEGSGEEGRRDVAGLSSRAIESLDIPFILLPDTRSSLILGAGCRGRLSEDREVGGWDAGGGRLGRLGLDASLSTPPFPLFSCLWVIAGTFQRSYASFSCRRFLECGFSFEPRKLDERNRGQARAGRDFHLLMNLSDAPFLPFVSRSCFLQISRY